MPRLRFSLKLLLLGSFVCAGLAAWYAVVYKRYQFRNQELAKLVPVEISVDFQGRKITVPDRAEYLATPFPAGGSNWSWLLGANYSLPIQKLVINPPLGEPFYYSYEMRQQFGQRLAKNQRHFDLRAVPELEELDLVQQYNPFQVETAGALSNLVKVRFFANDYDGGLPVLPRVDRQMSHFVRALPLMPRLRELTSDGDWNCLEGSQFAGLLDKAPNLEKMELGVGELGPEDAAAMSRLAELTEVKLWFHEPRVEPYYDFVQAVLKRPQLKTASLINYPVTQRGHQLNPDPSPPNETAFGFIEQDLAQAKRTLELRDSLLVTLKMKGAPQFVAERCPALTKVEIEAASSEVTVRDCAVLKEFECNARIATLENCPQLQSFQNDFTQRITLRNVPLLKQVSFELLDELIVKEGVALEEIMLKNYVPDDERIPRRGVLPVLNEARGILPPIPTLQRITLEYLTPELIESLVRMKTVPKFPALTVDLNNNTLEQLEELLTKVPLRKLNLFFYDDPHKDDPSFTADKLQTLLAPLADCESLEELSLVGLSRYFYEPGRKPDGTVDHSFAALKPNWTVKLPPNVRVLRLGKSYSPAGQFEHDTTAPLIHYLKQIYPKIRVEGFE
jgi:hypothetical protein